MVNTGGFGPLYTLLMRKQLTKKIKTIVPTYVVKEILQVEERELELDDEGNCCKEYKVIFKLDRPIDTESNQVEFMFSKKGSKKWYSLYGEYRAINSAIKIYYNVLDLDYPDGTLIQTGDKIKQIKCY